jgi:hypothetical protein
VREFPLSRRERGSGGEDQRRRRGQGVRTNEGEEVRYSM